MPLLGNNWIHPSNVITNGSINSGDTRFPTTGWKTRDAILNRFPVFNTNKWTSSITFSGSYNLICKIVKFYLLKIAKIICAFRKIFYFKYILCSWRNRSYTDTISRSLSGAKFFFGNKNPLGKRIPMGFAILIRINIDFEWLQATQGFKL